MSFLTAHRRPVVAFDVKNRKHRQVFFTFVKTGSWASTPILFYSEEETMVDVATMQRQLVEYYMSKEFSKVA